MEDLSLIRRKNQILEMQPERMLGLADQYGIGEEQLSDEEIAYLIAIAERKTKAVQRGLAESGRRINTADVKSLKDAFLRFVRRGMEDQGRLKKGKNVLRLATYNVHFFTNLYDTEDTYSKVVKDIFNLDADVLVIQEIIIGGKIRINDDILLDVSNFYDDMKKIGYSKIILCNSVPSWYSGVYGNAVLVKEQLIQSICSSKDRVICKVLDENIFTFSKSTSACIVSGGHQGSCETRCYINIMVPFNRGRHIHIFGTHLDVASEDTRLEQVKVMIEKIRELERTFPNDVFLIMGDFNSDDPKQYTTTYMEEVVRNSRFLKDNGKVVAELERAGFVDSHRINPPFMTAWNNIRVDFIFIKDREKTPFVPNVYYTDASDHIPVFIDMENR